ncbi:2-polyprenylphenol 6-hydroxylase [Virgibacillus xinjiangensis]|uniref:2-polyprenylphenol 6-hydroxylase n=1 Tax=Virgibacillus xinjiangensis TaxID=393090 RepID=A0ABV7CX75_9BACI
MQRYREIAIAFSRNGFGFLVKELGLHKIVSLPKRLVTNTREEVHTLTLGERLRKFLEDMGPSFIKLGQIASTRRDLIPEDIIKELEKLQDQVPPFPYEDAKEIVEQELGASIDHVFVAFDEIPLAAASIGQVHRAVLYSGEEVAVKIQRPNIQQNVHTDLEILQHLARMAENRMKWAERYHVTEIVQEFSDSLLAELDYTLEGRNAHKIVHQFRKDPKVRIPEVYWEYTTEKVLTMEYMEGTKLDEVEDLILDGFTPKLLAERLVHSVFHQILMEGFFHADPHPGNVKAQGNNTIVFIDFGMVGRLTPEMKDQFSALIVAMMRQDNDAIIKVIYRMGLVPSDIDMRRLKRDVDKLKEKYYDVPFSQVSIGEAVNDLFTVASKHRIEIPADLSLVGKTLLTLEGTVERLDPEISIVKIAEPFGRKLLKERLHPKRVAGDIYHQLDDYKDILAGFPEHIEELYAMIRKRKIPVEISFSNVDSFMKRLIQVSNRLSFSIVLLSFSIIMVGLIIGSSIGGQSTYIWNLPVIEIGFVVAILMFIWLIYSIIKSGRF